MSISATKLLHNLDDNNIVFRNNKFLEVKLESLWISFFSFCEAQSCQHNSDFTLLKYIFVGYGNIPNGYGSKPNGKTVFQIYLWFKIPFCFYVILIRI